MQQPYSALRWRQLLMSRRPVKVLFVTISLSLSATYGCWYFIYMSTKIKHSQSNRTWSQPRFFMFTSFTWTKIILFYVIYSMCLQGTHRGFKDDTYFSKYLRILFICMLLLSVPFLAFCNGRNRTEHSLVLTSCVDSHSFPFAAVEMKSIRFIGHFLQK